MNSLRQLLFRARKLIDNAHFPEGSYIVYWKKRYYFTLDYPLSVDTEKLDGLIEQIQEGKGMSEGTGNVQIPWQQYEKYCEAYTGEFLPKLSQVKWVILESIGYQKWYYICLDKLSRHLKEQRRFEKLLRLTEAASRFYPYDKWQLVQMECLIALGRRREAEKIYEEASMFDKDMGVNALERTMAGCLWDDAFCPMACTLEKVKEDLVENEEEKSCAYYCSYPGFVDFYRIKVRMDEENHEQSLLILCTLSAEHGEWEEAEGKEQMELFKKTLMQQLKTEDIYTQYSKNQFLVLMSGIGMEGKNPVISCLRANWKKSGGRAKVKFSVDTVKRR